MIDGQDVAVPDPQRETVEQMAERYGLPVELLNAPVRWCNYGHTKADHDAAGACVRPSLDARAAAAAAYPDATRAAVRIAFERGWDAATAGVEARVAAELRAVADNVRKQAPGYIGRIDTADSIDDRAAALAPSGKQEVNQKQ